MNQAQVIVMTPELLKEYAFSVIEEYEKRRLDEQTQESYDPNEVVYGMRGIRDLFNISNKTAWIYKNTFLKPAITQRGRKIITNVALAKKLFNESKPNLKI